MKFLHETTSGTTRHQTQSIHPSLIFTWPYPITPFFRPPPTNPPPTSSHQGPWHLPKVQRAPPPRLRGDLVNKLGRIQGAFCKARARFVLDLSSRSRPPDPAEP